MLLLLILLLLVVTVEPAILWVAKRRGWTPTRRAAAALGFLWLCLGIYLTLTPYDGGRHIFTIGPFRIDRDAEAVDFTLNVLMFVPPGLLSVLAGLRRPWLIVPAGLLFSASIELAQLVSDIGRTADVKDLLSNTLGCALGVAAGVAFRSARRRTQGRGRAVPVG